MEVEVIEDKKNFLVLALKGERHTFPGLLCWALLKDKNVKTAVYEVEHPVVGIPKIYVRTTGKETPRKAIQKAIKVIHEELDEFRKISSKKKKKK